MHAQVTYAGSVRAGDSVRRDGNFVAIARVRRAQGRKPASGENLHLVTEAGDVIKVHSEHPVRVLRQR